MSTLYRLSFVCTGNICRSPMGEVVFRTLAERSGFGERFEVTSRGTHGYHVGDGANPPAVRALERAGYDASAHRSTRLSADDLERNDLLIALDRGHERIMLSLGAERERVRLLTDFDPERPTDPDVFDPWGSADEVFVEVLEQVERSCRVLLDELSARVGVRA